LPALQGQRLSVEHVHMLVSGSSYLPWHVLLRDDDAALHVAAAAAVTSTTAGTAAIGTAAAATAAAAAAAAAACMAADESSQRSEHWPTSTASSTPGNNNTSSTTITAVVDSTALTTRLWCNVPPQCVSALPTVMTDLLRAWSSGRDRAAVLLHCYELSEIDENGVSLSGGLQFRVLDMQLLPPHTSL
jgi:hypothetical protein